MLPEYRYKQIYNPKSNRLQNYDYGSNWWYFITICTKNRENYFGEIIDGKMILNEIWKIVEKYYLEIIEHFPFVILDEFVIMPNHIHGIIIIDNEINPVNNEMYTVEMLQCNISTNNKTIPVKMLQYNVSVDDETDPVEMLQCNVSTNNTYNGDNEY